MYRIVFFISTIVLCTLVGCGTGKPTRVVKQTVTDSTKIEVTTRKRDTLVTIPGDTLKVSIPIFEITEEPITRTNGRTSATVNRTGNDLTIECLCEEYKQLIEVLETTISKQQKVLELRDEINTEYVKYTPWYIKSLAFIGVAAIIVVGAKLILKFKKPF